MELLEVDLDKLTVSPSPLAIEVEPFRTIIRRDKGSPGDSQGRNKQLAKKELMYIFLSSDYSSPYLPLPQHDREITLKKTLDLADDWKEDDVIKEGIAKYVEMTQSDLVRLFISAKAAIYKLASFYETLDFNDKDDKGKLVYTPNMVTGSLKDLGNVSNNIMELEKQVKSMSKSGSTRGGVSKTKYNS